MWAFFYPFIYSLEECFQAVTEPNRHSASTPRDCAAVAQLSRQRYDVTVTLFHPLATRLTIEVVHDLICPWCYIGIRRLMRALHCRPEILVDLSWRPFLLNPDMPSGGLVRAEYIVRKYGGEDRARRLHASVAEIGRFEGIDFRFDRISRVPSSLNAHRLVGWATNFGLGRTAVEAIFAAHFTDGRDISEINVLTDIAASCGLNPSATRSFLFSDDQTGIVHSENLRAHRLGINGVPCLVVGGYHAIAGAQEPEVIERLLDIALVEASEF